MKIQGECERLPPLPLPVNDSLRKATILLLHIQIESTQAALPTGQRAPDNGSKEAFSRINLVYKDSIMRRQAAGFIRLDPSVSFRCLSVKSVRKKKKRIYGSSPSPPTPTPAPLQLSCLPSPGRFPFSLSLRPLWRHRPGNSKNAEAHTYAHEAFGRRWASGGLEPGEPWPA